MAISNYVLLWDTIIKRFKERRMKGGLNETLKLHECFTDERSLAATVSNSLFCRGDIQPFSNRMGRPSVCHKCIKTIPNHVKTHNRASIRYNKGDTSTRTRP